MSSQLYRRRKRRKERRAQTNTSFKDIKRRKPEHKGTNDVMDTATYQALLSQGTKEAEITYEGASGLKKSFISCPKRENHDKFIPATAFTMDHLPREFQHKDIHDCIKELIMLCVCVWVKFTSKNRPQGFPFSQIFEGEQEMWGSGSVFLPAEENITKDKICPCHGHTYSSNPWYSVLVSTAYHVIYDDLEASQTQVAWQFNDDAGKDTVTWLQGIRLVNSDKKNDRCIIECITHDVGIPDSIRESMLSLRQKEKRLNEWFVQRGLDNGRPLLAVIVSHPHGGAKQVSLGTNVVRRGLNDDRPGVEWTDYFYNAHTCRGSSGALVWLPGQMRLGIWDKTITVHTHSGGCDDTMNMSSGGLDYVARHNRRLSMRKFRVQYPV